MHGLELFKAVYLVSVI